MRGRKRLGRRIGEGGFWGEWLGWGWLGKWIENFEFLFLMFKYTSWFMLWCMGFAFCLVCVG